MRVQAPDQSDRGNRVIKFTPRTRSTAPPPPGPALPQNLEMARQHVRVARDAGLTDQDEFRHRMLINLAAFVFTAALTAAGIWLAISIADLRQTQDCVLSGRRICAPVVPSSGSPA